MVDMKKLAGKMAEQNVSVQMLADELKIDRSSMYRRLKANCESMTVKELVIVSKALKLEGNEIMNIFFIDEVALYAN